MDRPREEDRHQEEGRPFLDNSHQEEVSHQEDSPLPDNSPQEGSHQEGTSLPDNNHQEEDSPHSSVDLFSINNHRNHHQAVLVYLPARQITNHLRRHHQTRRV